MKRKLFSMLMAGLMITNSTLVAFAKEMPEETIVESTQESEEVSNDTVQEINESSNSQSEDTSEDENSNEKDGDEKDTVETEQFSDDEEVLEQEKLFDEDGNPIEEDENLDEDEELIEEEEELIEEEDEDLGKIIKFESLSNIKFDCTPSIEEIEAALPKTVTAIVKGKDEDEEISIDISFNYDDYSNIAKDDTNNLNDETLSYTLEANVSTSYEIVDGLSNPTLNITVLNEGLELSYQELTDEESRITVSGMLPAGSKLVLDYDVCAPDSIKEPILEAWSNEDTESNFIEHPYFQIVTGLSIVDGNDNIFTPIEGYDLLVTIKLTDEDIERIAGHNYNVFYGENEIEHSFSVEDKTISFRYSDSFDGDILTITGIENQYYYTVTFNILSKKDGTDYQMSSSSRLLRGSKVIIPEFYDIDHPKISDMDWSDVEEIVTHDAVYTKYIDSKSYDIETGSEDEVLEAESYGEILEVEKIENESNISEESVEDSLSGEAEDKVTNNESTEDDSKNSSSGETSSSEIISKEEDIVIPDSDSDDNESGEDILD